MNETPSGSYAKQKKVGEASIHLSYGRNQITGILLNIPKQIDLNVFCILEMYSVLFIYWTDLLKT